MVQTEIESLTDEDINQFLEGFVKALFEAQVLFPEADFLAYDAFKEVMVSQLVNFSFGKYV